MSLESTAWARISSSPDLSMRLRYGRMILERGGAGAGVGGGVGSLGLEVPTWSPSAPSKLSSSVISEIRCGCNGVSHILTEDRVSAA